ncbi:glycosyl hydrolase family 2 [Kribbella amoyensis]|uniref:Glycosyl hydrolase family 2 n=1 Tax=Kribbella amoyensis TaxID=996641 RepID=A0A561BUZ4_9ACTN|nr:glycoside hydrolase family 2 TIM barrel-domain containing protein [Kribbella amoyensis]TWD82602.1 glycosyl hydrolase family 2 [Kribbella amoyensis]
MRTPIAPSRRTPIGVAVALIAVVALLLGTAQATAVPPRPPVSDPAGGTPSTVRGKVVDARTGAPIEGASVHASRTDLFTTSGADGSFVLPAVPESSALVVAGKEGYDFASTTKGDEVRLTLGREKTPARAEYPRPDADRRPFTGNAWLTLNGTWSFDFDPGDVGEREQWFAPDHQLGKAIRVPFGYQSLAAWGEEQLATNEIFRSAFSQYRGTVWYQRSFTVPAGFDGKDVRLRIGAADWGASVWLDGEQVLPYSGDGYTEIQAGLGKLEPGSTHRLTIRVVAPPTDAESPYPQGKQTGEPDGEYTGWFTDIGGIWQSVWIEPYSAARLTKTQVTPELTFTGTARTPSQSAVKLDVAATGADKATVRLRDPQGKLVKVVDVPLTDGNGTARVLIDKPRLWEPNSPALYSADFQLGDHGDLRDGLRTSFGMRKVDRQWAPGHDGEYQYINLNNRPIYVRGVLDQAYNPWGVYTYTGVTAGPDLRTGTDQAPGRGSMLRDLKDAKALGFNVVRTHVKVNEPAYYHLADQLGLMVWYDMPNAGWHSQGDPKAEQLFEDLLRTTLQRDHNHPSIVFWTVFNEAWGISDNPWGQPIPDAAFGYVRNMVKVVRDNDPSRLVVDNSACCSNGHLDTDLNDFHYYLSTYDEWKRLLDGFDAKVEPGSDWNFNSGTQSGQPWLNSEFSLGSGRFASTSGIFRSYPKLNGYVAVQLAETEQEDGSAITFDRQHNPPIFVDHQGKPRTVEMFQRDDAVALVGTSTRTVEPGDTLEAPVKLSHFGDTDLSKATLRWKVGGYDDQGRWIADAASGSRPVSPGQYTVSDAGVVSVKVPAGLRTGYLWVWLDDGHGTVAENYLTFDVPWSAGDAAFSPGAPSGHAWTGGTAIHASKGADRVTGFGRGYFEYQVAVPEGIRSGRDQRATLIAEVSSTQTEGWYDANNVTAARRYPTELTVSVNGVEHQAITLPDDPNDPTALAGRPRGPLAGDWGSRHGYRIAVPVTAKDLGTSAKATLRFASDGGGLSIFGVGSGRYGVPPRLVAGQVSVPDERPAFRPVDTRLSVYQAQARINPATGTGTVIVSVVNDTAQTVRDIDVALAPPSGWTAEATEPARVAGLKPGQARHLAFAIRSGSAVSTGQRVDFTATASWSGQAVQAIASSTVGFDPAAYPKVDVDDSFDTDTRANYTVHKTSTTEELPELTFGSGSLRATSTAKYFGVLGHQAGPAVPRAVVIVDHQQWIGTGVGQDALFNGLIKDQNNYLLAWTESKGRFGIDYRIDGRLTSFCCVQGAPLKPGDRWAFVLDGNSISLWAEQGLGWTQLRPGTPQDRIDFTAPGALTGWHYAAGLRGNAGTQAIGRLEGRSRP